MYALDAKTGRLIWKFKTSDKVLSCACVYKGRVYFGSNDHNMYCLDARTGELIWKFKTMGEVIVKALVAEGRLYFGSYDQNQYCLDAISGRQIWKFQTQGIIICKHYLLHEGRLYFPSFDNFLRAVDAETGRLIWKFPTGKFGGMVTGPHLHNGVLYQSNREGVIYAISTDGKEMWNWRINESLADLIVFENKIFVGSEDDNLYCIDLKGKELWRFRTQGIIRWNPTGWNGKIYFPSFDCNIYCISSDKHELIWKFRTQGEPSHIQPPFESVQLVVKKSLEEEDSGEQEGRKKYDVEALDESGSKFYKSRITYQIKTQYNAKGKYQSKDDDF
jgi:outer membrane protein assembly factor BamB